MGTAAHAIDSLADFVNPNVVKVVCDAQGMAHYFSRAPIPFAREHADQAWWETASAALGYPGFAPLRHIGIYSYRAGFLRSFPSFPRHPPRHWRPWSSCVRCGTATASPSMSHPMHPALAWTRARIWSGCAPSCPIRRPESAGR